MYKLKNCWSRI